MFFTIAGISLLLSTSFENYWLAGRFGLSLNSDTNKGVIIGFLSENVFLTDNSAKLYSHSCPFHSSTKVQFASFPAGLLYPKY